MADDLVPFEYKYGWQRDMFDLILMSKANKIIGGTSGFCRLASLIGNGREPFFGMICLTKRLGIKFLKSITELWRFILCKMLFLFSICTWGVT